MRLRYVLALGSLVYFGVGALLALGSFVGCSSSDSSGGGSDAGTASDTSTSNDSGGHTDSGGGDSGGTSLTCDSYCALIMQNCTGGNAEYTDLNTCKAMCASFAVGDAGDQSGDSLACRLSHAGLAAGNPSTHCRHAGPTGGGTCGTSPCTGWCELDRVQCPNVYASQADCETTCAKFPVIGDAGDIALVSGNSFNCRIYHLEAAYSDPTVHCPHTALIGGPCSAPADAGTD